MAGTRVGNLSSGRKPMSRARILQLRAQGMTYRMIGRTMAAEEGRSMPYLAESVSRLLWTAAKREREYAEYLQIEAAQTSPGAVEVLHGRR